MPWRDRLLEASFRGAGFEIAAHDASGGRRAQTHEYPGRDRPFTEDLGRRAHEFQVEGYIVGDDYMARRDALIEACDKPGAGQLVHPYLGRLDVTCTERRISERTSEGRMCRVFLQFVESGQNRYPAGRADTARQAGDAAAGARNALAQRFARSFGLTGLPGGGQ